MVDFATLAIKMDNRQFLTDLNTTITRVNMVTKRCRTVGLTLSALAVPLGLFARSAVKNLTTFDDEMTKSLAIIQNVDDEMRSRMEGQAKLLSTKLPLSADEAAKSYFYLASAGLTAEQSLKSLPVVAKFATAGAFDMATATDLLTDAQSALGLTVTDTEQNMKNMTYLSDLFVKGNTLANTSVQQLSEALTNDAGATIQSFNMDMENSIAVLAAYADRGIKGAKAGSMFGRMIRLLSNKALENKEAFARAGIEVFDAGGRFRDFGLIVSDLESRMSDMSAAERVAEMQHLGFSALVAKSMLPLIGTSESIAKYTNNLKQAGGVTEKVVNTQLKSLGVQFQLIRNKVKVASIELAEKFEPEIRMVVDRISDLIDKFRELSPRVQKIIGIVIAGIIVLGPALLAISFILPAFSALLTLLGGLATKFLILKSLGIGGMFGYMAGAVLSVVKVFAGMALKLAVVYALFNFLKGVYTQIMERTKDLRDSIGFLIKDALAPLGVKLEQLNFKWSDLLWYLKAIGIQAEAGGKIAVEAFIYLGEVVYSFVSSFIENNGKLFNWFSNNWRLLWENGWDIVFAFGKDYLSFWKTIGEQVWSFINGDGFDFEAIKESTYSNMKKVLTNAGVSSIELVNPMDAVDNAAWTFGEETNKILEETNKRIQALADESVGTNVEGLIDRIEADPSVENVVNVEVPDINVEMDTQQKELENALVKGSLEAYKAEKQAESVNRNIKANENTAKSASAIQKGIEHLVDNPMEEVAVI